MFPTMSENVSDLVAALAKFQAAITPPPKNREVDTGKYSYKYAELDTILEHVKKPFAENGFAWTSWIDYPNGARPILTTRIYHVSGQWIQTTAVLTASPDPKHLAGEITYWRRYSFCMLMGVASQEDSDELPSPPQSKGRSNATANPVSRGNDRAPQVRQKPPVTPNGAPDPAALGGSTQAPSGPGPGSGVGSGSLNSDPLKAGAPAEAVGPGPRMAGPAERDHVAKLATTRGWTHSQVAEYILRRYDAAKLTDLFMPQYTDLVAVLGSLDYTGALRELASLPAEGGPSV